MVGKLFISWVVLIVAVVDISSAALWTDLRVKYAVDAFSAFHQVGRTQTDALNKNGFVSISQADCVNSHGDVTFNGFRVKDPQDEVLSVLYDRNEIVAGIQTWHPHDEILVGGNPYRFDLVPIYQNVTVGNRTYFVSTVYFVPPETICEEGRTEESLIQNGTGTGLWLQQGPKPTDSVEVPHQRDDAIADGWTKNSCFPGMGRHNFYEVAKYHLDNCTTAEGIFLLFNLKDELTGFGFHIQGVSQSDWVEYPPNLAISAILGAPVPECILESNTLYGTTTMHVYFTSSPWTVLCPLDS